MAESQNKTAPDVKARVRRMAAVAGFVPESAAAEAKLGWYGVELAKFLNFCKGLPAGTDLMHGMEGYGRYLKGSEPPLPDWRLEQVREALRLFQKGIGGWHIGEADESGEVRVDFRVKTQDSETQDSGFDGGVLTTGKMPVPHAGDWLVSGFFGLIGERRA
jgi:hypothetical protein